MYGYQISAVVMLANLLIASMTYTFDDVYSAQGEEFTFQNAHRMLTSNMIDPLPPPFNLLGVPFNVLRILLVVLSLGRCDMPIPSPSVGERHSEGDGADTSLYWLKDWIRKVSAQDVAQATLEYVKFQENQVAESGQWRRRMLAQMKGANDAQAQRMDARIDKLQHKLHKTLEKQQKDQTNMKAELLSAIARLEHRGASTATAPAGRAVASSSPPAVASGGPVRPSPLSLADDSLREEGDVASQGLSSDTDNAEAVDQLSYV